MARMIPSITDASQYLGIYVFVGIISAILILLVILADKKFNKKEK